MLTHTPHTAQQHIRPEPDTASRPVQPRRRTMNKCEAIVPGVDWNIIFRNNILNTINKLSSIIYQLYLTLAMRQSGNIYVWQNKISLYTVYIADRAVLASQLQSNNYKLSWLNWHNHSLNETLRWNLVSSLAGCGWVAAVSTDIPTTRWSVWSLLWLIIEYLYHTKQ